MPRPRARLRILKKLSPRAWMKSRAKGAIDIETDRDLVPGRERASARRTRSRAAGPSAAPVRALPAISAPPRPTSSVPSARCEGKGAALIMPACNTEAMQPTSRRDRQDCRASRPRRAPRRSGRLAHVDAPHGAAQHDHHRRCRRNPPNSTRSKTSGSSCGDNWLSNRVFKSYDDTRRPLLLRLGTTSSISPGESCPSDCATGRIGF